MFGGELYDGKKNFNYSDLFVYSIARDEWRRVKSPSAPTARSACQAAVVTKGE
jgi:hypothetical protein